MKALIDYIQGLEIGQGRYAGQPFKLLPWEKGFLKGAFAVPGDARLTISRGNGKSTLFSAVAAACVDVDGPLVEPMAESVIVASSFDQGTLSFRHVLHFLRPTLKKYPKRFRVQDSANRATIHDRETGAMLRVLGSDPKRAHGIAPRILLLDELAQWPHVDAMLSALKTSRGKIPDSKALMIGTRPANALHPFEVASDNRRLVSRAVYASEQRRENPFLVSTWRKANPSWSHLPDLQKIIQVKRLNDAKHDASCVGVLPWPSAQPRGKRYCRSAASWMKGIWERAEVPKGSWSLGESYILGLGPGAEARR